MRVLHVSEAFGGGIAAAIQSYMAADGQAEHRLLAIARQQHAIDSTPEANAEFLPRSNHLSHHRRLREAIRAHNPDVVHAHSTIAGVLCRIPRLDFPVVYSPHGFAHARTDVPAPVRGGARMLESVLSRGTAGGAAVSPWELEEMHSMRFPAVRLVPNELPADITDRLRSMRRVKETSPNRVVIVGRISPQKAPEWAVRFARAWLSKLGSSITWIGGGDSAASGALERAGVEVSGWIPRSEVWNRMAEADVYLHTAAWEGMPITILEALALGLPMLVRRTTTMSGLPLPPKAWVSSPEEAAILLRQLGPKELTMLADQEQDLFDRDYHRETQAEALAAIYAQVTS